MTCREHAILDRGVFDIPILVAVTVCQHKVGQLLHHRLSGGIHKIERIPIIRLDELILRRQSRSDGSVKIPPVPCMFSRDICA